ncbi:unnamed protein product [Rhizophagus irregularis]|nr:unnamed protein product [Rhizophagus irregularis]
MECHCRSFLTGKYTRESAAVLKPILVELLFRAVAQLEENLRSLELFKISPAEQMKRLDEVFKPTEIPFPYSILSLR